MINKEIKISAVINTYNEEENIEYCIKSLLWCDQIFIVDMKSDDKTIEIASKYKVDILEIDKIREFDIARKVAISNAKYDWVLLVDADEIIPKSLADIIKKEIQSERFSAYKLPRLNYIFGIPSTGNGLWPDYQLRLFKKNAVTVTGEVHNFLHLNDGYKAFLLDRNLDTAIQHFTYNNLDSYLSKINLYTSLQAEKYSGKPKNALFAFIKEFLFRYFRLRGFKDGKNGFQYAFLLGTYKYFYVIKTHIIRRNIDIRFVKKSIIDKY